MSNSQDYHVDKIKIIYPGNDGSKPSNLIGFNNKIFFTANDGD
ncbi:MAG: hypothetical protein VKN72_00120 [Nostocales cyanobacterium 94392]|nr:hypothetical protein [Nostocales cyanobacterium 94392]